MRKCRKKPVRDKCDVTDSTAIEIREQKNLCQTGFGFSEYIGHTVTVYVNSGGVAGNGFTGVLIAYSDAFVKLLVKPSAAPACSMGNSCNGNEKNQMFCFFCPYADSSSLGTMVEIPVTAIVAFVHNILAGRHHEI